MMLLEYWSRLSQQPSASASAEQVFRRHVPRLYSLARRMMDNDADAEDVVGDVLVAVLGKLDSFRGEAKLSTWLHRVTVNAALMLRRKRARRRECQLDLPPDALDDAAGVWGPVRNPENAEQRLVDGETRQGVERAITRLPQIYRDVFVLADVEQLPNAEIAELLGLSLAAVKSRLHQARLRMREALASVC